VRRGHRYRGDAVIEPHCVQVAVLTQQDADMA
jgi:hypothetical protein